MLKSGQCNWQQEICQEEAMCSEEGGILGCGEEEPQGGGVTVSGVEALAGFESVWVGG